jgi:hypothetical protein
VSFFGFSSLGKNTLKGEMKGKREKTTREQQRVFLRAHCFSAERDEERRKRDFKKRRRRRSTATVILHAGRRELSTLLNVVYVKLQIDGEIFAQLLGELVRDAAAIFTAAHGVA